MPNSRRMLTIHMLVLLAASCALGWHLEILPGQLSKVERLSGKDNYYQVVVDSSGSSQLQARYKPGFKTAVFAWQVPDSLASLAMRLSWNWRILTYPSGADERVAGKGDSPAAIYCTFQKGLSTYTLKYVYSSIVPTGTVIPGRRELPLHHKCTVVLRTRSGENDNDWHRETVLFRSDFQRCFGFAAPSLGGFGIMTDGDGTNSIAAADYRGFTIYGE